MFRTLDLFVQLPGYTSDRSNKVHEIKTQILLHLPPTSKELFRPVPTAKNQKSPRAQKKNSNELLNAQAVIDF